VQRTGDRQIGDVADESRAVREQFHAPTAVVLSGVPSSYDA
jgi:hypothetical protein